MRAPTVSPLGIVYHPAAVLRAASAPVTSFDTDLCDLAERLRTIMAAANGIGLAAPQIGVSRRVVVTSTLLGPDGQPLVLVNPVVVEASDETAEMEEGCLSLPGIGVPVSRPRTVAVAYQDVEGVSHVVMAQDLSAACVQHEIDHLDGVLILDTLSRLKRERYEKRLAKHLRG